MLDIVESYHCLRFQGKRVIQIQENGEKSHLELNLGLLNPNSARGKSGFVIH